MNKPLKILFTPLSSFISHVTRCLSIANVLKERGHKIEFLAGNKNRTLIENSGYKVHCVYQTDHNKVVVAGAPYEYLSRFRQLEICKDLPEKYGLRKMIEDELRIYSVVKPDIIVCDSRPTVFITSAVAEIPCMLIKNTVGYIEKKIYQELEKSGFKRKPENDYTLESEMTDEYFTDCIKLSNMLKKTIKPIPYIIPGFPEFEITDQIKILQKHPHCYVGPLYWNGWENMPKPRKEKYEGKKVILVTLGSSFPFKKILTRILDVFSDDEYRIIVNTGGQFEYSPKKEKKVNYEVLPYISLPDFLDISDVVIFHGGHGSLMHILEAGLPSVTIPFNGDQMEISCQIEKLQCGVRIKKYPDDITSSEIKNAVKEVLSNGIYKKNIAKYKQLLKKWKNGARLAADYVEKYWKGTVRAGYFAEEFINMKIAMEKRDNTGNKSKSLRILFAVSAGGVSNITRCLCIAKRLQGHGHAVDFISGKENIAFVQQAGFNAHEVFELPVTQLLKYTSPGEYVDRLDLFWDADDVNHSLQKMIHDDLKIYSRFNPDIIIVDGRITSKLTAWSENKMCISISSNTEMITEDFINTPEFLFESKIGSLIENSGLNNEDLENLNKRHPYIISFIPSFDKKNYKREDKISRHCAVGPLTWNRRNTNIELPLDEFFVKKVIVITLENIHLYKNIISNIINSFGNNDDYKIIINTDDKSFLKLIESKTNCYIMPYAAYLQAISYSDVVIYDGGHGIASNLIELGIPGIAVPFNKQQMISSKQFEASNCIIRMDKYPGDISNNEIKEAIMELLVNNMYRKNLGEIKSALIRNKLNNEDFAAADFIEYYYNKRNDCLRHIELFKEMKKELVSKK